MTHQRPLTVLHTVRSLTVNGITSVVLRTVEQLASHGVRSLVVSVFDNDEMAHAFRDLGVEPVFLNHAGPATLARSIREIARVVEEHGVDVVHTNQTIDFLLGGLAARARKVPVLASIHWLAEVDTGAVGSEPGRVGRIKQYVRVLGERALATRIVAVSRAVRETHMSLFGRAFPADRVDVVYPGISMDRDPRAADAEAVRGRIRREFGVENASPLLLNIGRLHPVKNQLDLMPMMRRIHREMPDARLLIAGGGPLHDELRRKAVEQGVQDIVRLPGSRLDIADLLDACDALVMSSVTEAAPLPLIEAMRAGRPVVATRVGGVPEMVEDGSTGFIVPARSPAALAAAVERMFREPGLAPTMGEAGRRLAHARFDIVHVTAQLERIYRELVPYEGRESTAALHG